MFTKVSFLLFKAFTVLIFHGNLKTTKVKQQTENFFKEIHVEKLSKEILELTPVLVKCNPNLNNWAQSGERGGEVGRGVGRGEKQRKHAKFNQSIHESALLTCPAF